MTKLSNTQTVLLEELVNECAELKQKKDAADVQYKRCKNELETLCAEHIITSVVTTDFEMKITKSRRFKAYSDDKLVLGMIPLQHRADCTSLNKKKIDGLIKKGVLSNSIKDEERFTRITTTKFTVVE